MDSKRLFKRSGYWWRLFLPLIFLLFALIGVQAYFRYNDEKDFRSERLAEDLDIINARIVNAYETGMALKPFLDFIENYYKDTDLAGVRISIYNDRDSLIDNCGVPVPRYVDGQISPELAQAMETGSGTVIRPGTMIVDNPYYFFGVLRSDDGKIFVHTAMPYTDAIEKSTTVSNDMWFVVIPIVIIATLLAFFFTSYLARSVNLLHAFAAKAASGEEIEEIDSFPNDELGDISRKIVALYKSKAEANERSEREHRLAIKINEEKIRVVKQLTNNINHELKTPVGVIKGYLDTIAEHEDMDEALRQRFIKKAQEHMDRLCNMLNDLSSITRLEEGGAGVMRERVDFTDLIKNVAIEINNIKLSNDIKFVYDVPDNTIVFGNYNLLYGMIVNLVRNADFHSHGTECGVKYMFENAREYQFSFFDNGTGVAEEHLPHLFDRFYRIDKGRSRKVGGTGLGLPIVKNTINVMGGTIMVKNRAGGGLEFIFTLPKWKGNEENKSED